MARALFMFGLSVTGTPTVELTQCNPGWWCNPPVTYTAATLNAAINAAGAAATATLGVNTAVWAAVFLNVPSIGRVGEYGTFVGHPTETTTTVKAAFGTLPSGCTLGVSVLSRDEAIGVGVMSNQWVALAGWFNGAPVTLGSSELGFLSISVRSDQPVLVSKIVNGAYHIYSDAVFLAQGFSDISGLPAYLSPPPAGITGIANLLTEQGFRDIVLAAGGPDLYASPGFDANLVMYLDPYVPDPLVMSVAVTVADVFHNRVTRLLASEGVSSFTMCGSLLEVAGMNIWVVLRTRLLALGVPVPFAICLNGVATEATRVLEGAHALEYAPHRP